MNGVSGMTVIKHCVECNEVIFRGIEIKYPLPFGDCETDVDGKYLEGCGRCEECGRELCESCGDIQDGVCESCREELGREEILVEDDEITTIGKNSGE